MFTGRSDVKHIELLLEPLLAVGDADLPDEARQIVGAMNEHLKEVLRLLEYIDELKPEKDRNVRIPLVKKGIRVPGFKEAWNAGEWPSCPGSNALLQTFRKSFACRS